MRIRLSSFASVTVSHSPYRWSDIVYGYGCLCGSRLRELDTPATSRWGALPLSAPQLSRSFFDAAKRVRYIESGEIFKNQTEARNTLVRRDHVNMAGVDQIGQVCRGQRKSAGGYTWELVPAPTTIPLRNSRYRGGDPIRTIDSAFDTARKRIGRKDLHIHDLRHTIATWLTRDRTPLSIVQTHLGHRRIETTLRYAHTDVSAVTPFLDEILDGGALPWHGEGAGISGENGTNPERKPNNKADKKLHNGSVPVMFEGTIHSSD